MADKRRASQSPCGNSAEPSRPKPSSRMMYFGSPPALRRRTIGISSNSGGHPPAQRRKVLFLETRDGAGISVVDAGIDACLCPTELHRGRRRRNGSQRNDKHGELDTVQPFSVSAGIGSSAASIPGFASTRPMISRREEDEPTTLI